MTCTHFVPIYYSLRWSNSHQHRSCSDYSCIPWIQLIFSYILHTTTIQLLWKRKTESENDFSLSHNCKFSWFARCEFYAAAEVYIILIHYCAFITLFFHILVLRILLAVIFVLVLLKTTNFFTTLELYILLWLNSLCKPNWTHPHLCTGRTDETNELKLINWWKYISQNVGFWSIIHKFMSSLSAFSYWIKKRR